jgi:hypothetical protein
MSRKVGQDGRHCCGIDAAKRAQKATLFDGPNLLEQNAAGRFVEIDIDPVGRGMTARRHRRRDHNLKLLVDFRRRDDQARPGFLEWTYLVKPNA